MKAVSLSGVILLVFLCLPCFGDTDGTLLISGPSGNAIVQCETHEIDFVPLPTEGSQRVPFPLRKLVRHCSLAVGATWEDAMSVAMGSYEEAVRSAWNEKERLRAEIQKTVEPALGR